MRARLTPRICFLTVLAIACALASSGCEPAPTDSPFPAQIRDGGAISGDAATTDGTAITGADPYSGAWALATDWSVCVTIGDRIETRSRKLLLVNLVRKGNRLLETRTLCQLQLTPIFSLKTVVPEPVLQAVGELAVESRLLGEGSDELAYAGGIEAQLMGVKMINPIYDKMPAKNEPSDPRLTDPESDGKPGATFVVGSGCKLYVAQREVSTLAGRLVSPGRFEGTGVHATEQVIFGSSTAVCGQTFKTLSNTAHHRFVLQRMKVTAWDDDKNGEVDCKELIAHQTDLLTWATPDDTRCPKASKPTTP